MKLQNQLGGLRSILMAGTAVLLLAAAGSSAQASVVYNLDNDQCTGGCGTPPFGTVTLTQNGVNLDITVHLLNSNEFVKTGALDSMAFEFNAVGVVLADISVDAHTPTLTPATGSFSKGSVGDFAFGITCGGCGNGAGDAFLPDIKFHIANATIADVTTANAKGNVFAADLFASNGNTGPVGATGSQVPEPLSLSLVGGGLLALGLFRKRLV